MSEDTKAILDLIERETTAFLCRDYPAWADCWIQDEGIRRLGALTGGVMDYHEGWATSSDLIRQVFERYPDPNPGAALSMQRSKISIRISGEMAWASFDQYGVKTDDPLVTVGLSHEIRFFEKHGEQWKISMVGHGNEGLEYYDFPVIRIDESCRIEWMNAAAHDDLGAHPAMTKSGAYLRGRHLADDKRLRAVVREVAGLSVIERRPSIQQPRGRTADPLILNGDATGGQHIVWVSSRDGLLLVTYRDSRNERARLKEAAELFELSPGQLRVAELVLRGQSIMQVADQLEISSSTAKTHLTRIFDKTGARNQPALISKLLGINPPG